MAFSGGDCYHAAVFVPGTDAHCWGGNPGWRGDAHVPGIRRNYPLNFLEEGARNEGDAISNSHCAMAEAGQAEAGQTKRTPASAVSEFSDSWGTFRLSTIVLSLVVRNPLTKPTH
jgi:hypothetical protein